MAVLAYYIVEIVLVFTILGIIFLCPNLEKPWEILLPIILGACLTDIGKKIRNSLEYMSILWKLLLLTIQVKPLRISFATLIRIKVDNKYLLVLSKRSHLYQPPGGVLRFYDSAIKERFSLVDDKSYKKIPDDEFRLRFLPGSLWKIFSFLKWFDSKRGRELDPHREFQEELVDTNILNSSSFSKPQFQYIKRVIPPITFGNHFQIHEFFLFEIFEMVLNEEQKKVIKEMQNHAPTSNGYTFLSAEEIERCGFDGNSSTTPLGGHTKYIL